MCKPFKDYLNVVLEALDKYKATLITFSGLLIAIWITTILVDTQKQMISAMTKTAEVLHGIEVQISTMNERIHVLELQQDNIKND